MTNYSSFIEGAELFEHVRAVVTTGDVSYPGTAMEVQNDAGQELFHIVVDSSGTRQVLFLSHQAHYRITLDKLEEIIARAKEVVKLVEE
jgi:hypothetical protein